MEVTTNSGKTMSEIADEVKEELKDFIGTRAAMFVAEMREKMRTVKMAAPAILIGLALLWVSLLVLTACLVCAVALAFPSTGLQYIWALLIVGVGYLAIGGLMAWLAWRRIAENGIVPERTIRVLKQDQIWLETEAKL